MNEHEENNNIMADIQDAIHTMEENNETSPVETAVQVPENQEPKEVSSSSEEAPVEQPKGKEATQISAEDTARFHGIVERGIRAGMSVQDVLDMPSAEAAEKMVAMAEKAAGISPKNQESGQGGAEEPVDELAKTLEEMEKDGGYDPNLMKLIKGLYAENKALKTSRATEARQSVFDTQFNGLDEGVRSHVDAATKSVLKKKFDFLKSAHEAAKDGTSDKDVFDEAKKLVLGDIVSQHEAENKAAAAAKRNQMVLARPGGASGLNGQQKAMTESDVAQMLMDALTK